jgi:hypothetical protein
MAISNELFERYIKISKSKENYLAAMSQTLDFMVQEEAGDSLDSEGFSKFMARFNDEVNGRFHEIMAIIRGIYDRYLTEEDIEGLIEFFLTPTGKKYLTVSTPMGMEIMKTVALWSKTLGKEIMDCLHDEEMEIEKMEALSNAFIERHKKEKGFDEMYNAPLDGGSDGGVWSTE